MEVKEEEEERDSISTSLTLGLFKGNINVATYSHSQKRTRTIPLSMFREAKTIHNWDSKRICSYVKTPADAFAHDRLREGIDDIDAVVFHMKRIKIQTLTRIWVYHDPKRGYILLDGVHRIVAAHLKHQKEIGAWIISPCVDVRCKCCLL